MDGIFEDKTGDYIVIPPDSELLNCPNDFCGTFMKRMKAYYRVFEVFMFHYIFIFLPLLPFIQLIMPLVTVYGMVTFAVCKLSGGTVLCD